MSFMRTLATIAVGFAAARGVDKYRKMGGMDGVQDSLRKAGDPGGMGDQLGQLAEKMGIPGGADAVRNMFGKAGTAAADGSDAAQAGLGNLMNAMRTSAVAGTGMFEQMLGAVTKGTPVAAMAEENAKLMIRAMIQAAKADGEIDAEERAKIMEHLGDATKEEIAFVKAELDAPLDIGALASEATEATKGQVYAAALMTITADTPAEKTYLSGLAKALGLDGAKVAQIHQMMGKPAV